MFKYNEDRYITDLGQYVEKTYSGHYVGANNIQALDLIFAAGHGHGFCTGNILKYAPRYGKKKGYNRDDLMKTLHYALLMLYVHDTEHAGGANGAVVTSEADLEPRAFMPAPRSVNTVITTAPQISVFEVPGLVADLNKSPEPTTTTNIPAYEAVSKAVSTIPELPPEPAPVVIVPPRPRATPVPDFKF